MNIAVNFLNLSSLDVMESILLLLTPVYPSAAIVLNFLYPPNLFFLKVFVTTLPIFPSDRIRSLASRPFENAVLSEHEIVLCFQSMSI